MEHLRKIIETAWDDRNLLREEEVQRSIREAIHLLDLGQLRVATPSSCTLLPHTKYENSRGGYL